MLPLLIPAIMWIGHEVFGAIEPTAAQVIASKLAGLSGSSGIVGDILNAFKSQLGTISKEQEEEFTLKLNSLLGQLQLDTIDEKSEHFIQYAWRPFICWGLGVNMIIHYTAINLYDIVMALMHGTHIPPMDIMALSLMTGLLGLGIVTRSFDKAHQ